jgi:hypothetical protein
MRHIILWTLAISLNLYGQAFYKQSFSLGDEENGGTGGYLLGNGIVDMLVQDSVLWASTGFGLNRTGDAGITWTSFTTADYIGKGGISSMAFMDDSTLWVATAFDTTAQDEDLPAGGGLSYTRNGGETWFHLPQPVDSRDEEDYKPTTTVIQNLTYDIAFVDSTAWIASFGGGLRRSDDMGQTWQVVTTDGNPFSSLDYLNHRAFSLLSENGNLWVGSADGISKSVDNGQTWERFTSSNQEYPLSGNFVVALGYQEATNAVWAATIEAVDTSEVRAVSRTTNGGITWEVFLPGIFAHNFAFDGHRVYVVADEGVFLSEDDGKTWYQVPPIRDAQTGEEILTDAFYSAGVQQTPGETRLWLGSAGGLATTIDNGYSWKVIRSFISTTVRTKPKVYAYPSPFAPDVTGFVRFQYDVSRSAEVKIDIYNFAMEHVVTLRDQQFAVDASSMDRSTKWDGTDDSGNRVASGVYFFRANVDGETTWGKLVVINRSN